MGSLDYTFWLIHHSTPYELAADEVMIKLGHHEPAPAYLHMDLADYITSTIAWIPSKPVHHSVVWAGYGFTRSGPIIIEAEGARLLEKVSDTWATLFAQGQEELFIADGPYDAPYINYGWHIKDSIFKRDQVVARLRTIADLAKKAQTGEYYILQFGV